MYIVVSASAFAGIAAVVPLVLPEVLRAGGAWGLGAVALSVALVAALAVRQYLRTALAPRWWAWWATFVLTTTGWLVVDDEVRQLVALSLIVGPVYGAMFMPLRRVLVQTLVAGVFMAALAASTDGPWPVRVLRVCCSFTVSGTLISGLVVLRRRLDRARELADESSRRDPLTSLLNRRGLHHHLPGLLDRAAAEGRGVVVAVADIDRFKSVNDTHGHAVGDTVLVAVADAMRRASRPEDLLARLGGEELLLVAVVSPDDVPLLADRLRTAVEEAPSNPHVTVSVGAAWAPVTLRWDGGAVWEDRPEVADVLFRDLSQRADVLMYAAKEAGRNRARTEFDGPEFDGPEFD